MKEEEIIASGLLELYITGSLSKDESLEVEMALERFPSLKKELEAIEDSLMKLSETTSGEIAPSTWDAITRLTYKVRSIDKTPRTRNWNSLMGWAASLLFFSGLVWMLIQNNELKSDLRTKNTQNIVLKEQVTTSETQLAVATDILEIVRSKDFKAINLPGNPDVSPDAYVTIYYNKYENTAYIDAKGLPTPPKGKVYQVWSLVMDPLTPSSIGLLSDFENAENKFFKMENIPPPEAFGITLEPQGGSESPTLSQLYTLGMITP